MIHYLSPYRSDKDIGKAYNEAIEKLDSRDWVCLMDADAMPLLPDYGTQIEQILSEHGRKYGLIGAMTNRAGRDEQLYNGFSEDPNILNHIQIAREARDKFGNEVEPMPKGYVAGLFMLFSVKTWVRVGGFKEGTITADSNFTRRVRAKGLKVGMAKGLYIFHLYRMETSGQEAAKQNKGHLE